MLGPQRIDHEAVRDANHDDRDKQRLRRARDRGAGLRSVWTQRGEEPGAERSQTLDNGHGHDDVRVTEFGGRRCVTPSDAAPRRGWRSGLVDNSASRDGSSSRTRRNRRQPRAANGVRSRSHARDATVTWGTAQNNAWAAFVIELKSGRLQRGQDRHPTTRGGHGRRDRCELRVGDYYFRFPAKRARRITSSTRTAPASRSAATHARRTHCAGSIGARTGNRQAAPNRRCELLSSGQHEQQRARAGFGQRRSWCALLFHVAVSASVSDDSHGFSRWNDSNRRRRMGARAAGERRGGGR